MRISWKEERMKIHKFTPAQQDLFREECNFSEFEMHCFECKVNRQTDIQISIDSHVSESTVAKTMRIVRSKIVDVMQEHLTLPIYDD